MRLLALVLFAFATSLGMAQDIAGRWVTVNDETGIKRSVVEIVVKDGVATGHVVRLFRSPDKDQDPTCSKCTDDRRDKKIIGMQIIRNMKRDGSEWSEGTIMDPENGKVYDCKIWVEDGTLKVRGYIAFFYRTQTWLRAE